MSRAASPRPVQASVARAAWRAVRVALPGIVGLALAVGIARAALPPDASDQETLPLPSRPAQPGFPQPGGPGQAETRLIRLQAGTGQLVRLPQPAATVLSAEPGVARVQPASPTSLFLMGVAAGRTTVVATNASGAAIAVYDVTVTGVMPASGGAPVSTTGVSEASARAAQTAITQNVQGASDIRVRVVGGDLQLTGTVTTAAAMQQAVAIARSVVGEKGGVLNRALVLGGIQVNVRVRIAEIDRQITRQLGVNWQALGASSTWRFGLLTGTAAGGAINPLVPLGLSALSGASAVPNQIGAGYSSSKWDVNAVIDALAADQLITILAEPNLTAQSGETASFLAGGEFPIPVAANNNSNGGTTITVEFKQFGVSLAVVPTVLSDDRVNLRVRPEVSQLTTNGAVSLPIAGGVLTIPALTVRRAETTIELGSGQSFAIAGLLEKTSTDGTNAVPYLGEVPVLGALFKSNNFQRGETELVIIVTPYLVKPVSSPSLLRAPTDGFRPATDIDRILLGRQLGSITAAGATADAGFILK